MKLLPTPPMAHMLMSATRHIGYSLESAIADLVDNSIAAHAANVYIDFTTGEDGYLYILDDGLGMSKEDLCTAMQYGSTDPNKVRSLTDLGRYGLGLKTASLSQCRCFTVVSYLNGHVTAARWDLDYVTEHKELVWPLMVLDESEYSKLPGVVNLLRGKRRQGTLVIWQNIDFGGSESASAETFEDNLVRVQDHLSLVFHRYIRGEEDIGKLTIKINNSILKPKDPFLQYPHGMKQGDLCKARQSIGQGAQKVFLEAYILPHEAEITDPQDRMAIEVGRGLKYGQGFYIYRNKRLITYGSWFGATVQGEFSKLARILVDIPNTADLNWSLDVKKSMAIPPPAVRRLLKEYVRTVARKSQHAYHVRAVGRKKLVDRLAFHPWNIGVDEDEEQIKSVLINREYPAIRKLLQATPALATIFDLLERTIPIDAIYYSRSSDRPIENSRPFESDELLERMKECIRISPVGADREAFFDLLLDSDPFNSAAEFLLKHRKEILNG